MADNILGCFVSSTLGDENGKLFREYIFGENGISEKMKKLKYHDYGQDVKLVLFQFYVNPIPYLLQNIKEVENYRKKEKAIGMSVIVDADVFLSKTDSERITFLKTSIGDRLKMLEQVVGMKRLDTNVQSLIMDFEKIATFL